MNSVQEPDDNLLMAPSVWKDPQQFYITMKVQTTLLVHGSVEKVTDEKAGIVGFMVVFKDYEKALAWVNGDKSLIQSARTG